MARNSLIVMAPLIFAALAMRLSAGLWNSSGWVKSIVKGGGCARAGSSHSGWLEGGTSLEGEAGGTAGATPSSALAALATIAAALTALTALALPFLTPFLILLFSAIVSVEDV